MNTQKFRFTHPALTDEDDNEIVYWLGGKMEVCSSCNGTGHHVRRDIDDSRMVDNMMEDGDDEGLEAYFNGAFDCVCNECNGRNVVFMPNMDELPKSVREILHDYDRAEYENRRESEAERRMGA